MSRSFMYFFRDIFKNLTPDETLRIGSAVAVTHLGFALVTLDGIALQLIANISLIDMDLPN